MAFSFFHETSLFDKYEGVDFNFFFYIKHLQSNIKPAVPRHIYIHVPGKKQLHTKKGKKKSSNIYVVKNNLAENMNINSPK